MKCCVSTDVGTWTNWLTFEPDPDHSPDAGTGLFSPISYKRCYAEVYVGKIPHIRRSIGGPPLQRAVVLKWFYSLSRRNSFVGVTCALPNVLLVITVVDTFSMYAINDSGIFPHRRRLLTNYSAPRTTWPESSARAGVAPTPGRSLHWLPVVQRVTYKDHNHSNVSQRADTDPSSALFRCSVAGRSSHTHRTDPSRFCCCCSIHLKLSTCWHSTVRKHSHFKTPFENPSVQTHFVLLCCIKRSVYL